MTGEEIREELARTERERDGRINLRKSEWRKTMARAEEELKEGN